MPDVKFFLDADVLKRMTSEDRLKIMTIACEIVSKKFYPDDWQVNTEKVGCRILKSEDSLHVAELSVEVSFSTGKYGFDLRQITNQFKEELRDDLLRALENYLYPLALVGSIDVWPGPRPGAAFKSSTRVEWLERKLQG